MMKLRIREIVMARRGVTSLDGGAKDVGIEKKEGRKALKQWIFLSIVMLF